MSASAFDSTLYGLLWGDAELAKLFSDTAEIKAMLIVEGALAEAQAKAGLIPEDAAAAIKAAAYEAMPDAQAMAAGTGKSAVPVPALVDAFRKEMGDDPAAAFVHYGATSQDIIDTALALRLRQALALYAERLRAMLGALADLAEEHATLPMAARTYGQAATPTSFGAVAAGWGRPLLALTRDFDRTSTGIARVSLSGAAGTLSAMGPKGPEVRAHLAAALDLSDPEATWHTDRTGITALAAWIARLSSALAKIGEDLLLLTHNTAGEVRLSATGGSSTMPQKTNPVQPSQLVALSRFAQGQNGVIQSAAAQREQRDGAAWMTEWLTLPGLVMAGGRALSIAAEMIPGLIPVPDAMAAHLDDGTGLIYAEALSFRLAQTMPRPEAQAAVKALATTVREQGGSLKDAARAAHPDAQLDDIFDPVAQLGTAPDEARAFAKAVRSL